MFDFWATHTRRWRNESTDEGSDVNVGSGVALAKLETVLADSLTRPYRLKDAAGAGAESYEYVIVDTPRRWEF